MKVAELSTKVDALIALATDYKRTADNANAKLAAIPEDDPEVATLAARVDSAIAVLQGVTAEPAPEKPLDPNEPA